VNRFLLTAGLLALVLAPERANAGPPRERGVEPLPLARAPELARRPVELVFELTTALEPCTRAAHAECSALGPAFGGRLAPLYRPSPYFAFGGALGYAQASGSLGRASLERSTLALGMTARVYLLEEGALDPYLETTFGWASERTRLGPSDRVAQGPCGRAGGGVDLVVASGVRLGALASYTELMLRRRTIVGGLALSVLWGERL
jgi:hypothetical protein